jgi:hypothetical protein
MPAADPTAGTRETGGRRTTGGYRFTANFETNLQVAEVVVVPRGSTVYGRLANAKSAGNVSGGAELTQELTDIVINGTAYPLLTVLTK